MVSRMRWWQGRRWLIATSAGSSMGRWGSHRGSNKRKTGGKNDEVAKRWYNTMTVESNVNHADRWRRYEEGVSLYLNDVAEGLNFLVPWNKARLPTALSVISITDFRRESQWELVVLTITMNNWNCLHYSVSMRDSMVKCSSLHWM